jgi:5'-deoxynucleotidase YfbR-like HD superfamily hydrolase
MNISLNDLKHKYYVLQDLVRFQTSPRLHDETVMSHSGYVAALVCKLHDIYDFDIAKALKLALFHDYPEALISDIPHNVKVGLGEEMNERLSMLEYSIMENDLSHEYADLLRQFNDMDTPEGLVVALADIMSVEVYCEREILMGNSQYYSTVVLPSTLARKDEISAKLKPYSRGDDKLLSKDVMGHRQ